MNRGRSPLIIAAVVTVLIGTLAGCMRTPGQPPRTTAPATTQPQTKKVRYGPFTVPNVNKPGQSSQAWALPLVGITLDPGMLNEPVRNVEKPCADCWITNMKAGLEHADGSQATISRGLWLHHMVALATGAGKSDATCASSTFSLPHISVGGTPMNTERFFASGNERTPVDLTRTGSHGYRLNPADRLHLLVELMNLTPNDETVWLTVEYTYVPGSTPGVRPVKPVWLDAANCGTSEAPAQSGAYALRSSWTSTISGTLVEGVGHLHDGGTRLTYDKNGEVFCTTEARYGTSPDFIEPDNGGHGDGGGHSHGGAAHISEMTRCPTGSTVRPGDVLTVSGYYDESEHEQMVHAGRPHPVMALGILYYA